MTKQLDEEQTAEAREVCDLLMPYLTQAIADGVLSAHIGLIDRYREENKDKAEKEAAKRHRELEMELWSRAYAGSIAWRADCASSYHIEVANNALRAFNERFPK